MNLYDFPKIMSAIGGSRIVVIGGAGFVGSHLVDILVNHGARVTVLDDFSRGNNYNENAEYWNHDARNVHALHEAFMQFRPEMIFNLAAAVAGVSYNQNHNLEMLSQNLRLQVAPVEAADWYRAKHFLQVSSACIYGKGYTDPCIEENGHKGEPVAANYGYSIAKRVGEIAVQMSTLNHAVIVRPSNIYGPRDYFDDKAHVIPKMIKAAIETGRVNVMGDGKTIREFIYVHAAATGMIAAAVMGEHKEAYNLGSGGFTKISMLNLAQMIQRRCGNGDEVNRIPRTEDAGDMVRWSSHEKAASLNWSYGLGLESGIAETVAWYKNVQGRKSDGT